MKNQFRRIFFVLATSLFLMTLIRISLYLLYPSDFADLTIQEVLLSFFMGVRVDIITLFTFSSLFILLLSLIKHEKTVYFIGLIWASVLITIFTISFSGVLYFDFIHRHISNEVFNLANDLNIIFNMATNSYLYYTLFSIFFIFIYFIFMHKVFKTQVKTFISGKKLALYFLLTVLLTAIGIRNSFSNKSFGSADAFAVNKVSSGNLALNSFFTIYRTAKNKQKHDLLDFDKSIEITQNMLQTPNAPFIDEEYPLLRKYSSNKKQKHNVVIVLLESWGAEHIDGFTKYKELNVTPFFKKLSNESLKFTNFYANGYRSIFGITSIFTGITLPSGFGYLGKGLELSNISYLGTTAKENGYTTLAMQGSNRRSYRVDAVSNIAGFDAYYGAEDIPNIEITEGDRKAHTGTFDYNLFDFYHKKINTLKEPFLTFAFSSTNHSDFHVPRAEFEKFPHDLRNYNGSLNAYLYVDNAIEKFINGVKNEPWFDNTIFIFTADHGGGDALDPVARQYRPDDTPLASIEHFRIPLVIYAPKIFKAKEITTLGSQNDIFPTIVDMLGFDANISVLGNSLLDADVTNRFAYLYAGNLISLITDDGYIKYNFKNIVEKYPQDIDTQKMQDILFALDTAEATLLEKNKWAK